MSHRCGSIWSAVEHSHADCLQILVHGGADVNKKDHHNRTPLHLASIRGDHECVRILLHNNTYKKDSSTENHLKYLFSGNFGLNKKDTSGYSPLHYACINGSDKCVQILLDNDALVDIGDQYGQTPLYHASKNGHHNCIQILIDRGADKNVQGGDWTPLHAATFYDHIESIQVLLDNGVNTQIKDSDGRTASELTDNQSIKRLIYDYENPLVKEPDV